MTSNTKEMLDSLTLAVNKALDKKRRLNQYAVVWKNNQPTIIQNGEDLDCTTTSS